MSRDPREHSLAPAPHTGMALPALRALAALRPPCPPRPPRPLRPARRPTSCTPRPPPPCAPCLTPPAPPCRAAPPERVQALRVTCCPPPRGCRPPCVPPAPACALTCAHAVPVEPPREPDAAACGATPPCGAANDRVALRLAAARAARQRDYEREVAERAPAPRPASVPYALAAERPCARATDGRDYRLAPPAPPAPDACGPCRRPPPPRCVELVPDDKCRPRDRPTVDPCAHRPRILMNIDRSTPTVNPACPPKDGAPVGTPTSTLRAAAPPSRCGPARPPAARAEGLTSRIMKSLNLSRGADAGGAAATCPRRPCDEACARRPSGTARRAGDASWCSAPPRGGPAPPKCREPTLTERLRRGRGCPPRRLHTSASVGAREEPKKTATREDPKAMAARVEENSRKLEAALKERAGLKEAARGRAVGPAGGGKAARPAAEGRLDLPVPPGAAHVQVRVQLGAGGAGPCAPPPPKPACVPPPAPCAPRVVPPVETTRKMSSAADRRDSWLSIKGLQKRFAGSRKSDDAAKKKSDGACPPRAPASPCAPAKPPPCPAPRKPYPCDPPFEPGSKPVPPRPSKPCAPPPSKPIPPPPSKPGSPPKKPCDPPAPKPCDPKPPKPCPPRSPCDPPKKSTRSTSAMELAALYL